MSEELKFKPEGKLLEPIITLSERPQFHCQYCKTEIEPPITTPDDELKLDPGVTISIHGKVVRQFCMKCLLKWIDYLDGRTR